MTENIVIVLKFKSNKDEFKLKKQIENVLTYLQKRYNMKIDEIEVGTIGNDFLDEIARLKITFKQ